MKTSKLGRNKKIGLVVGILILLFLIFFFVTASIIGSGVKVSCQQAQDTHEGDCVDALMSLIEDQEASFEDKNSAVWALGQLGDERALPFLQKYYNGEVNKQACDRSEALCQYELQKAVKLLEGGLNVTAFIWR